MSEFTWIPLFREIASKLLTYENRQQDLIDLLKQIKETGLPVTPLGDVGAGDEKIELEEIDPFTFFSTFCRGIRHESRVEILRRLKEHWDLQSDVPTDFKGIPFVNNMRSWFFHWKRDRDPGEIPNLWNLAHEVLDKTPDDFDQKVLNKCLAHTTRGMLTMGMYWINPTNYLALDRNNRRYLRTLGIESEHAKTGESYLQILREVNEKISDDYPVISHKARLAGNERRDGKTPRVWTISTGENGSQWGDFLENGIISIEYSGTENLKNYESLEDLKQKVWGTEAGSKNSRRNDALACWQFANEMQVGDYVFAKQGGKYFYGLCRVTGDYEFDENRDIYPHIRSVEWLTSGGPWEITKDIQPAYKTLTDITTIKEFVLRLFELVEIPIPENVDAGSPINREATKQYWWINADPGIWSYDQLKAGETQTYTTHNERGNKRQKYKYFGEVKPGDGVLGYVTSPQREVVALCEITKGIHATDEGECVEFKLVEYFNKSLPYEELKAIPELADSEPMKNNRGSIFRLEKQEYIAVREALEEMNPKPKTESVPLYTKQDILRDLFFPESQLDHILSLLKRKKNIILQGPPGVGKTYVAKRLAYLQMGEIDKARVEMIQFHQSYTYEDFVQGYRLNETGSFVIKNGIFYEFCRRAQRDPAKNYFFIIDEINRGNVSKIFGELMMLIEADKRGKDFELPLTYARSADERFFIPANLYLIGTMNTADRSLSMVDYALRRRFAFVTLKPQFGSERFAAALTTAGAGQVLIRKIVDRFVRLNASIASDSRNLGEGFCIGHSYFCPPDGLQIDEEWYAEIVESEVKPLLEEYWIDQENKVRDEISLLLAGENT